MSHVSHALNSTLNFSNKLLVITYAILIINDIDWPICSPYQNGPGFLPCSQRLFSGFSDFSFSQKLTIPNWLSICNTRKSPIIHIQILHTELHTFNRSSFYKFPLPFLLVKYWLCEGKIDVDHSWNLRKRAWLPPRAWSQATINAYKAGTNNR